MLNFVNLEAQETSDSSVGSVAVVKDAEMGREESQVEKASDEKTGPAPDQVQDS